MPDTMSNMLRVKRERDSRNGGGISDCKKNRVKELVE